MSRSRKRERWTTCLGRPSQKRGKVAANRRFRRIVRHMMRCGADVLPSKNREVTDQYDLGGDGKVYRPYLEDKDLRK